MSSFDDWKTSAPSDDMDTERSEQCDKCREPWAWVSDDDEYLCEAHADSYLRDEHLRDEGDDALAEERAERHREWAEGPR